MSENNGSGTNSMLAFLLGGAIGAGIALLYAPSSGEQTRRRIKEGVDRAKGSAVEGYEAALEEAQERIEAAKGYAYDKKDEVKAAIEAGKDAYQKENAKHQGA
ncbi:MAG: YtxH domain-containing protein [Deltaproteobacteria bacterium]|nr:YtxH domain-containing protein [Deltaproteobacteria bacterium]